MDVRVSSLRDAPLVEVKGEIDHGTCEDLNAALCTALDAGGQVVLIDLDQVGYIDSGGLSVLFSALKRLSPDGWLGLVRPNANVRRLFELVGLCADPNVRIFEDRVTAEAALMGRTGAA